MKSILRSTTFMVIVLGLASNFSYAQISLLSTDLTSIGDQITRYNDTIPTYGPGNSGANQTWDFSLAIAHTTVVTSVVSVSSTPYNSTFSGSDYAMTNDASSYLFFEHNASQLLTTGAAGDLLSTGEIIVTPFTNDLILHNFPREYDDNFNDTYGFQATADGSSFTPPFYRVRLTHSGITYDTTDAYGTLITPIGTYNALRVKTTTISESFVETQASQFLPFWLPLTTIYDTSVVYSWHAKEEMLAIADLTFDSIGNPNQFTYSSVPPVVTVGIADAGDVANIRLYPQPASDQLFISGLNQNGNHRAEIFSMDGKMIRNEVLRGNSLDVNDLKSGMYILRIILADGTRPEPMKFIIQ